jgi:hypothetical protein
MCLISGRDLFEEARGLMDLGGGTLSVDDTVLDKPDSRKARPNWRTGGLLLERQAGPRGEIGQLHQRAGILMQ